MIRPTCAVVGCPDFWEGHTGWILKPEGKKAIDVGLCVNHWFARMTALEGKETEPLAIKELAWQRKQYPKTRTWLNWTAPDSLPPCGEEKR